MNLLKKILLPLCSIFLFFQSIGLMKNLITYNPNEISYFISFIIGFLINLFVTGIFAFTGFAYPTNKLLSSSYYKINNPKRLKSIYNNLGVKYFKTLLVRTIWGGKNRKKFFDGTKQGFDNFIYQTKQSEFGHIGALVVILALTIILLAYGYYFIGLVVTLINIIGNLYPVILQRSHRVRIEKIFNRKR